MGKLFIFQSGACPGLLVVFVRLEREVGMRVAALPVCSLGQVARLLGHWLRDVQGWCVVVPCPQRLGVVRCSLLGVPNHGREGGTIRAGIYFLI